MKFSIKILNKPFLIAYVFLSFFQISFAADINSNTLDIGNFKVKMSGYAHFQSGYLNQNNLENNDKEIKSFSFFNDAALFFDMSKKISDITYGGKIVLVPTAKRKSSGAYSGSHIYLESNYGRLEVGSPINAANNMSIDASRIACGTGGNWDMHAKIESDYLKQGRDFAPSFTTHSEFFLDSKLVSDFDKKAYSTEPARKISYYTPKFNLKENATIQIGISYIPTSLNTGVDDLNKDGRHSFSIKNISDSNIAFKFDNTIKNALSAGVTFESGISDGVDLKLALTGECGTSSKVEKLSIIEKTSLNFYNLKNLESFNLGAVVTSGNFSYAASFGSAGKSLTIPEFHRTGRKLVYYTGGLAYKKGPFSTSLTYFHSNRYKNTVNCVILATDYKLASGFKPYVEVSSFTLRGKPEYNKDLKARSIRGTVALIGAKLSI